MGEAQWDGDFLAEKLLQKQKKKGQGLKHPNHMGAVWGTVNAKHRQKKKQRVKLKKRESQNPKGGITAAYSKLATGQRETPRTSQTPSHPKKKQDLGK